MPAVFFFFIIIYHKVFNNFHFQRALGFQILKNGNILVTDGGGYKLKNEGSKVFIIDFKGNILWKYDENIKFAHSAIQLRNENILIPDTNNDRLIEVDFNKKIVWSSEMWGNGTGKMSNGIKMDYPNFVQELENGHFLISDRYNSSIWEVDRTGKIFWSYNKTKLQHAPYQIDNGNIIIADSENNKIIEINKKGEKIWEYFSGLNWPRFAQRLKNGNTLITDSNNHRIIEVTKDGRIVFEYGKGELSMPYQAEELADGDILIADGQHGRLIKIDRKGKIKWRFEKKKFLLLDWLLLPSQIKNGGAEELEKNGLPRYWTACDLLAPDEGIFSIDKKEKFSGKNSFKIEANSGMNKNKMWGYFLKNINAKKISLKCMIKTKNVKGGAGVSINFADSRVGLLGGMNSKIYNNDTEWTELVIVAPVPKGTKVIAVLLSLVGTGTVWWDDVKLEKL